MKVKVWLVVFVLVGLSQYSFGQFQYHFNQDIPVVQGDGFAKMPWGGGLNAGQYNVIDLDNDGTDDLMIFDRDNNKVITFLAVAGAYIYAPEFEHLFPEGLESWVLLRDYNCDGKVDLFTSSIFGMSLYENTSVNGGRLEWVLKYETIFTEGSSGQINLQVSSIDLPGITDYDGDGDLDIMVFNFALGGGVYLHKNMSVERTGNCGLDLVKITERYGDFEECTCDEYIFGSEICNPGGRIQHSGGKTINSYPYRGQVQQDIVIGQEFCTNCGFLQNFGTVDQPQMASVDFGFPNTSNPITLNFPAIFNIDLDFDGTEDILAANNIFLVDNVTDYGRNNWFYKKNAAGYSLVTKGFLQEEMIDVGYSAAPALADIDNDGDEDLFIGSGNLGSGAKLKLYKNDGDALNPQFVLSDNDYLQLSTLAVARLAPQFLDLNQDGQQDLIITKAENVQQTVTVYWHTDNTLQPYEKGNYQVIPVPALAGYDNPYFYFSNGKLTLLIGREEGRLSKYINRGALANPQWELASDTYLGIDNNFRARNLVVTIADMDNDGKQDLICYDNSGKMKIYADFADSATLFENIIQDKTTLAGYSSSFGKNSRITTSYATGSKLASIVVGLRSGGVQVLSNIEDDQQKVELEIKIATFPNPVSNSFLLNLVPNQDVEVEIVDLWGQALSDRFALTKGVTAKLDIRSLREGLYIILAYTKAGKKTSIKFVVGE